MSESPEKYNSDQIIEGLSTGEGANVGIDEEGHGAEPTGAIEPSHESIPAGNGGFGGKEHEGGHAEVTERSPDSTLSPDLGFSSGERTPSTGLDANSVTLTQFEEAPAVQILVTSGEEMNGLGNADGENGSATKDEDVLVGHVSPEIEHITIADQESRILEMGHGNESLVSTNALVDDIADSGNQYEDTGKEDMFVDAPDELTVDRRNIDIEEPTENIDTQEKLNIQKPDSPVPDDRRQNHHLIDELAQLRAKLDKTVSEKELLAQEYKVEQDTLSRELANLHRQLEGITSQQSAFIEDENRMVDYPYQAEEAGKINGSIPPLQDMISDCSKFTSLLKDAVNEKSQVEGTVRELHTVIIAKDQEIEDLNAKVSELSVSHNVVISFLDSLHLIWSQTLRESSEASHERDMHFEVSSKNLLESLEEVIKQEDLLDGSLAERLSLVEKGTSMMVKNYNFFLSEIDRLGQCLTEIRSDFVMPEVKECGTVFSVACTELLECRKKELDFAEKLNELEVVNKNLLDQVNKEKERSESMNAEISKTRVELDQEKIRSATVREKLSMAVTKGKALVQQRDSLKQSLAEKATELERCLLEIQEKKNSLETAEVRLEELIQNQILAVSLQESLSQKVLVLKEIEEMLSEITTPDELQSMDGKERIRWLLDQNGRLEGLSQRDLTLKEIEDTLSEINITDELKSTDIIEKMRWLLDQKSRLEGLSQRDFTLKEIEETLSKINIPDELTSTDIIEKMRWLLDQKSRLEGLSQRDLTLKEIEETLSEINIPDELKSTDIIEKMRWLLDQKSRLEGLSQRDFTVKEIEETLSEINIPDDPTSTDIIEKIRWLLDEKSRLEGLSRRDLTLKEIEETFSEINIPDELTSTDIIEKIRWLLDEKTRLEILSQKDLILKEIEENLSDINMPDELKTTDIIEKIRWLLDQKSRLEGLLQKDLILKEIEENLSDINMPDELKTTDIIEKIRWLLDQKSRLEGLLQKDSILKEIEENLSDINMPEGRQSVDMIEKVRWLLDQKNNFEDVSIEYRKLKDMISSIDLPDTVLSLNLESQINWICDSFLRAKDGIHKLEADIAGALGTVSAHELELAETRKEIDHLAASLSAEKQETSSLRMELEALSYKYETVSAKEVKVSSEKDGMIRMFLEASEMENQGEVNHSDMVMLVEKCIQKIKEQTGSSKESLYVERERFEEVQSFLYTKYIESMLCEDILKEEMLEKSKVTDLSNELTRASQEIISLKDEKETLLKDLERSEDKCTLVREKLSLAVKKGKGMFQEREGLKRSLAEKNMDIENLKHELQQQVSVVTECRDQIANLSADLERIPNLESDLHAVKDRRDELEQFLLESNGVLQRIIESVESVVLPVDTVFKEPVEKITWLVESFRDYQVAKSRVEQDLEIADQEVSALESKLGNAYATVKSLEDELSKTRNDLSVLVEEKEAIQAGKADAEKELEKAKEEVSSQDSKFAEVLATIKSLEDALSLSENNISLLAEEKTAAQFDKTLAEKELEKAKEESGSLASKFAEACITIKSLEDALHEVDKNVTKLTEEMNGAQAGKNYLEEELEKMKDEAASQASKAEDAYAAIKSLEVSLEQARNDISVLVSEKKSAEEELITLNAKLKASMEELDGTHGSFEGRSVELLGHLHHLQSVVKDGAVVSSLTLGFKQKLESLKDLHLLVENIRHRFAEEGSQLPHVEAVTERIPYQAGLFPAELENVPNGIMDDSETEAAGLENISSSFSKIVEGLNMKDKLITDKFEGFSSTLDGLIIALSRDLHAAEDGVISMLEGMEALKKNVTDLEAHKQDQESTIHSLQNAVSMLLSACNTSVEELQSKVDGSGSGQSFDLELEKLNNGFYLGAREAAGNAAEDQSKSLLGTEHVKAAENLLLAARKVRVQVEQFENVKTAYEMAIKDLHKGLDESQTTLENCVEERDESQNKAVKLEGDLEALENTCNEMKLKLDEYHAIEDIIKEKEAEISALRASVATKEQEAYGHLLTKDQVEILFEKLENIEVPSTKSVFENPKDHGSSPITKLLYVIDSVKELQHQVQSSSIGKEALQSSLASHVGEIEHLKKEAESIATISQDLAKTKNDLAELALGVERIIQKLGGEDSVKDRKTFSATELFTLLEKLVMDLIWKSENSKTIAHELGAKLHGNQTLVDELTAKVTLLEGSHHGRLPISDTVQERSIFEGPSVVTGSEISEIESAGPVGRNSTSPPIPSAAHVRTMRKGSSDHLALSIDAESERLINPLETDDDKGHAFKSLNTSGLIPKQGKLIADRIDGIWVSGGRVLMSRPRARIGLVAYWLFLHIWLLGTIL